MCNVNYIYGAVKGKRRSKRLSSWCTHFKGESIKVKCDAKFDDVGKETHLSKMRIFEVPSL